MFLQYTSTDENVSRDRKVQLTALFSRLTGLPCPNLTASNAGF